MQSPNARLSYKRLVDAVRCALSFDHKCFGRDQGVISLVVGVGKEVRDVLWRGRGFSR